MCTAKFSLNFCAALHSFTPFPRYANLPLSRGFRCASLLTVHGLSCPFLAGPVSKVERTSKSDVGILMRGKYFREVCESMSKVKWNTALICHDKTEKTDHRRKFMLMLTVAPLVATLWIATCTCITLWNILKHFWTHRCLKSTLYGWKYWCSRTLWFKVWGWQEW